jgi:phosphate starvation-inducible PhoH-like protein
MAIHKYIQLLEAVKPSIVIATGPSGTGKTMHACNAGKKLVYSGRYQKVILTRPAISSDEELGFIPGTLDDKMKPWVQPSLEYLGRVPMEICPLAYMRGRTFSNSWIIADEMQNSTKNQMLMLLTRIGPGSKLVIIGDTEQCDRGGSNTDGLTDLLWRMEPSDEVESVALTDVKRHQVIKDILNWYSSS